MSNTLEIVSVNQHFIFRFSKPSSNESANILIDDEIGETEAYNEARKRIINEVNTSIRDFETEWMLERKDIALGISVDGNGSRKRLISRIKDIDGVDNIQDFVVRKNYEWQYNLQTKEGINSTYVIDRIRDISSDYLKTDDEGSKMLIVIDPPYRKF